MKSTFNDVQKINYKFRALDLQTRGPTFVNIIIIIINIFFYY